MIKVGVLGATGMVGQRFVQLLSNHPWFELSALAASERSTGRIYDDVVKKGIIADFPPEIREIEVSPIDPDAIDAEVVFSALPSDVAWDVEKEFAASGFIVASNASAHRLDDDVPLVIPEVNADHLELIETQRKNRDWDGSIVTNPNCSVIALALTLKPLEKIGILDVKVATMQAISGAGYDLRAMSILENVIPYIPGEEEKMEREGLKVLGKYEHDGRIRNASFSISASCHRVPVLDGHTEAIWVEMREGGVEEAIYAFEHFKNEIDTPTAPEKPIIVCEEEDRPQPRLDRDAGDGMSVTVGRIRSSGDGIKYIALGHNTIRGAAGASVLNAELLVKGGYI